MNRVRVLKAEGTVLGDLLEVLRVQRHDFLNHLQVISGLLQLKKYDRAQEYIAEIAEELGKAGMVTRLGCPEIVSVILTSELAASKQGLTINSVLGTTIDRDINSAFAVAEIIREMLLTASRLSETSPCLKGSIDFEITEKNKEYLFQVGFALRQKENELSFASTVLFMEEAARKAGARLKTGSSADGVTVITLAVPYRVISGE